MAGFRRTSYPIFVATPEPIIQIQTQEYEENVDGNILKRVAHIPVDLCSKEASDSLPTYKEYYLEELLKAGVPLDQINVSGMLNVTDMQNLKVARESALSRLETKIKESNV